MILQIPDILSAEQVAHFRRRLDEAETVLNDLRTTLVGQKAPAAGIASVDGQLGYVALLKKDLSLIHI